MNKSIFEVGDTVRVIKDTFGGSKDDYVGKIGIIMQICLFRHERPYYLFLIGNELLGFYEYDLELVEKGKPVPEEFKKGDTVRIIDGPTGIILSNRYDDGWIVEDSDGRTHFLYAEEMELINVMHDRLTKKQVVDTIIYGVTTVVNDRLLAKIYNLIQPSLHEETEFKHIVYDEIENNFLISGPSISGVDK